MHGAVFVAGFFGQAEHVVADPLSIARPCG